MNNTQKEIAWNSVCLAELYESYQQIGERIPQFRTHTLKATRVTRLTKDIFMIFNYLLPGSTRNIWNKQNRPPLELLNYNGLLKPWSWDPTQVPIEKWIFRLAKSQAKLGQCMDWTKKKTKKNTAHFPWKNPGCFIGILEFSCFKRPNEIIFHQPRFPWNKRFFPYFLPPNFGGKSLVWGRELIWPEMFLS